MKVAIVGGTGYGGIELVRLLRRHPAIHEITLFSSNGGEDLSTLYPHLLGEQYKVKEMNIDALQSYPLIFLATPPGISALLTPHLLNDERYVIDLSGDFRLKEEDVYEKWYKKKSAPKKLLTKAVYGLPEMYKEYIEKAHLIANPGCYATATLLGLAPLVKESFIEENQIVVDGKSGVSGAGKGLHEMTHFSNVNENLQIYKVNQHQHIPEIEQTLLDWNEEIQPITFSTHLVPMTRGIMTTIYGRAKKELSSELLYERYQSEYATSPFVRIHPIGSFPSTKMVYGSNYCDIGVAYDDRTGMVTIVSVIDNLMKGAAGQAIQNMNVIFGLREEEGLEGSPLFP